MGKEIFPVLCIVASLLAGRGQSAADVSLASVSSTGEQSNANAFGSLSANGEFVLLSSQATNLVVPDANGTLWDAFVRNLETHQTAFASVNSEGEQANGPSEWSRISADGRFVVFATQAPNMPGAGGNIVQVYIHDLQTGETELISQATNGQSANGPCSIGFVTPDGRFVTFYSHATNLVSQPYQAPQSFARDRLTGETFIITINSQGQPAQTFPNLGPGGSNVSNDGRFVVFGNLWDDLAPGAPWGWVNIYVHDRQTIQTQLVTFPFEGPYANGDSNFIPIISGDGRYVMFTSEATNLVRNDTNGAADVFVRDLLLQQTFRVSVSSSGEQGNGESIGQTMSANGRFIAFSSNATNFDPEDTNGFYDGFVHDLWTGTTERVTFNWQGDQINNHTGMAGMSDDGRVVGMVTYADNVIRQPVNEFLAIYVRARWKLGDVNRDGIVNVLDLLAIINAWGPCPAPPEPPALPIHCDADVTNDNSVNVADLLLIINNWG